ncbi:MAG: molybdate ABC transporter substrate-binding protein [Planctomycetaceae bacterium]|nr:molybdate ABC transporter substrate-binding protein [Planctomycetaceae bacterium]
MFPRNAGFSNGCQLLLAAVCLLLTGCGETSADKGKDGTTVTPVTVLAAASLTDVLEQAAARFREQTGIEVRISTGPSSGLARQVVSGAPVDLFLSASLHWAETVQEAGLVRQSVPLLRNRLILAVPQNNPAGITGLADLSSPRVQRVALAGENVPAGRYAEQALAAEGVLTELQSSGRLVRGHDVRHTLSYISRGEVDAGLVYATDLHRVENVTAVAVIPRERHQPIVYPMILIKDGPAGDHGQQFFDFLQTAQVMKIFREAGFEPAMADDSQTDGAADSRTTEQ